MTKPLLFALLGLLSLTGCDNDSDEIRPANYDILAMETGHWEWERTAYFGPVYTPATEGYTRQLTFKAAKQLLLRRSKQPDQLLTYQLAVSGSGMPTLTYQTKEDKLANNDVKYYRITQQNGQQTLLLTGEGAARDAGGYETYHWVKE
ncbi:MAG: hypothetical protein EOO57_13620 [Hymenobacter sp.]|nr:MAG: hypothetical protein EOO57_13620 [Hymenobacter sp.]